MRPMDRLPQLTGRLVGARAFEYAIIALILASGALLGLGTSPGIVERYGDALTRGNQVILAIFIAEAALKMTALAPRPQRYFRDGWNIFDFAIIVFALVPATGSFAMVARLGRLLRVLRLISAIEELRLIVGALVRSIPSVANIMMLMSIIVYIYAIVGYHLFHEADPTHWRTLGISLLVAVQDHHAGGLDGHHVRRDGASPPRVALLRQLRGRRHVRGGKPLHRRRHQQSGQGEG